VTERDKNGRFAQGNGGGPGRPRKERSERYYEILMTACTYDEWKSIVKKAVAQAKNGNHTARKWLGDYLVGMAAQKIEHTGRDGGPIEQKISTNKIIVREWLENDE